MKIFKDNFYIILQEEETQLARKAAEMRIAENLERKANESEERLRQAHWPGALSEFAVALFYDKEWEGVYYEGETWKNRGNDVKGLEIKSSFRFDNLCLEMSDPKMFPDVPFVFVKLTKLPNPGSIGANLKGWIYGREAPELGSIKYNGRTGKPFYLVHYSKFRKMEDLPDGN